MEIFGVSFSQDDNAWLLIAWLVVIALMIRTAWIRRAILTRLGIRVAVDTARPPVNRMMKNILYAVGALFVVIAALGPQWGQKPQSVHTQGLDICFALDLSRSMLAEDMAPSRLGQAKNQLSIFLPRLGGDRAALVGFAGTAYVAAPLTVDHAALAGFLDPMNPEFISNPSTNLGAGVGACLSALDLDGIDKRDEIQGDAAKLIVMISDGEETLDDDPNGSIKKAERLKVPVFAMAMGTAKGGPIPMRDDHGKLLDYVKDPDTRQPGLSKLEDKALKELAKKTGGQVFYASEGVGAWKRFEEAIQGFKRDSKDAGMKLDREERFQWPLLIAFLILLIDFALPESSLWGSFGSRGWLLALALGAGLHGARAEAASLPDIVSQIQLNNKAVKAWKAKDFALADGQLTEALAKDASNLDVRYNWATNKLFSAVKEAPKVEGDEENAAKPGAKPEIDAKAVTAARREFEKLLQDPELSKPEREEFRKGVLYQLGQVWELEKDGTPKALENYYRSLGQAVEKPTSKEALESLEKFTRDNIIRLLAASDDKSKQNSKGDGGGGGGGGESKEDKDKKDGDGDQKQEQPKPKDGEDAHQGKQKPKFSGSDVGESEARQILESVSGEEKEVQKRKARAEAKERSGRTHGRDPVQGESGGKPW